MPVNNITMRKQSTPTKAVRTAAASTTATTNACIGVVAKNSLDYVETVFESFAVNETVVPLRSEADAERIRATGLSRVVTPGERTGWFSPEYESGDNARTALISFTSGTEGAAKGVSISFRALNDVVNRLIEASGVDDTIKEYIGVPVYHSFGFGRCRLVGTVGGSAYLPAKGFDPSEVARLLCEGRINSISAVPSLLRILLEQKKLFSSGENLRWLEIGSQPMAVDEKRALQALFPEARIIQHYGLTEASRTTLLCLNDAPAQHHGSVGRVYGEVQVRINDAGRICIRGPHLADGLLIGKESKELVGSDGWFETRDLGTLRDGYLYFEGRADNLINFGGQKISVELVEDQLRKALGINSGFALARVPDLIYGESVLVAKDHSCSVELVELARTVENILAAQGISVRGHIRLLECETLPQTDTGKIKRRALSEAYSERGRPEELRSGDGSLRDDLLAAFQRVAGDTLHVEPTDNFTSLGLDSIVAVKLSMVIEKLLGEIPKDWRSKSISELSELSELYVNEEAETEGYTHQSVAPGTINDNPKTIGFWQLVKEDFVTHERDWLSQGFWAVFNHRFGNWRMGISNRWLRAPLSVSYRVHRRLIQLLCGIKLDYTVTLGRRVKLEHFGGMILGAKSIGDDVTIRQNTTFGVKNLSQLHGKPTIENGVNIGAGAVIVGEITVGRFTVIGPNAVVDRDVPPFSVVLAAPTVMQTNKAE